MNREHQDIQNTLQQLYELLEDDRIAKQQSEENDRQIDLPKQESDKPETNATPETSEPVAAPENNQSSIDESSLQEATQIQNYLNQLGNLLSSDENSQPSTNHPAQQPPDSAELSEENSPPLTDRQDRHLPDFAELSQELTDSNIEPESHQFSDDSHQQSLSSKAKPSTPTDPQTQDLETGGILEELLEQLSLDRTDSKAIAYEDLLEQLAIDRTDPHSITELNQLLSRLKDPTVTQNLEKSLVEELELDELLGESGDRPMQPPKADKTQPPKADKTLKRSDSQKDLFSALLSKLNLKPSASAVRKQRQQKKGRFWLLLSLVLLSCTLIPWFAYQYWKTTAIEKKVTKVLDSTPGIAFYHLKADVRGQVLFLTGKLPHQHLSDRATEIASATVPNLVVNNKIIVVDRPADLIEVSAEVEQIVRILNQIDGINISATFAGGQVILSGTSIQDITIKNITRIFEEVPGVRQVDNQITIQPLSIPIRIYFNQNSAKIIEDDLNSKFAQIKQLIQKYPYLQIKIVGYSHQSETTNELLELQRAQAVENLLEDSGIDRRRIQAVAGQGSPPDIASNQDRWLSRCVVFEIIQSDDIEFSEAEYPDESDRE